MAHQSQGGNLSGACIASDNRNYSEINHSANSRIFNFNFAINQIRGSDERTIEDVLGSSFVSEASFDTFPSHVGCMLGTRVSILDRLTNWAANDPLHILWLVGMAGTGKTSIAVTIARRMNEDNSIMLGGTFFCSRSAGSVARADVRRILPTLAAMIARQSPQFAKALALELTADDRVPHKPIAEQIGPLLCNPLAAIANSARPIVILIDALDECSDEREMEELLRLVADFKSNLVKFIFTSRPEVHIRNTPISYPGRSVILHLHSVKRAEITADIQMYIGRSFARDICGPTWYTSADVCALASLSNGLFIFASTVVSYMRNSETSTNKKKRLVKLLSTASPSTVVTGPLDDVYRFVLTQSSREDMVEPEELQETLRALACILAARTSLSVRALAEFRGRGVDEMREALRRLHSVTHVPLNDDEPGLAIIHASFGDYLFNRAADNLRISMSLGDECLSRGCLDVMAGRLRFNVSQCLSSFKPNPSRRPNAITLSLEYACLHWIHHIASLQQPSVFDRGITDIFRPRFLFWLEILSILCHVHRAAAILMFAAATVQDPNLAQFLRDANRFVASSHDAIQKSAPHIYLSALPFASKESLVYKEFARYCTGLVSVQTSGINSHGGRLLMTLSGHEGSVRSIAHSPDGRFLASSSSDGSVRLWDVRAGEAAMSPLQSRTGCIVSVAFAPDGRRIASGTAGGFVYVWDITAGGKPLHSLSGHSSAVLSVAYSPDGMQIASASADKSVRIWNATTGKFLTAQTGHTDKVRAVAFSPDGSILASSSDDRTISLRSTQTGDSVTQLPSADQLGISSICFSPDGDQIASSSFDGSIQLWDWRSGGIVAFICDHLDSVHMIRFSPNGRFIVSASTDKTVRIWDWKNEPAQATSAILGTHSGPVNAISYSPDGLYVASASDDGTIRIWHAGDSQLQLDPHPAHTARVRSVATSSDSAFIVSGSDDRSVCIWDASTGALRWRLLGHEGEVHCIAVSMDGRLIASGSADFTVRLWNVRTGKAVGAPRKCSSPVQDVNFSGDVKWLVTGSNNGTVLIWAVATWSRSVSNGTHAIGGYSEPHQTPGNVQRLHAVTFSPNSRHLAIGTSGPYIKLRTRKSRAQPLQANLSLVVENLPVSRVRAALYGLCRSGLHIALSGLSVSGLHATSDGLCEQDLRAAINGLPESQLQTELSQLPDQDLRAALDAIPESGLHTIISLLSHPDLPNMVDQLADDDLTDVLDNLEETHMRFALSKVPEKHLRRALDKIPESHMRAKFHVTSQSGLRATLSGPDASALRAALKHLPLVELRMAYAGLPITSLRSVFRQLRELRLRAALFRLREDCLRQTFRRLDALHLRAALNGLDKLALRAALGRLPESSLRTAFKDLEDSRLRLALIGLTESRLRAVVRKLSESGDCFDLDAFHLALGNGTRSIAFSPDSMNIASGVENGTIYIWDVNLRRQCRALTGHSGSVLTVAYHRDGQFIASGSEDTTVRLWNAQTGVPISTLYGHAQSVRSVAFMPNGQSLVSSSDDGTIRVWDMTMAPQSVAHRLDQLARAQLKDGWLVGPSDELLLWIPQDYCTNRENIVIEHHCKKLISSYSVAILAHDVLHTGQYWARCWPNIEPNNWPRS